MKRLAMILLVCGLLFIARVFLDGEAAAGDGSGRGLLDWPSFLLGLLLGVAGLALVARRVQRHRPRWPTARDRPSAPPVDHSASTQTDLQRPAELDASESPPTSTLTEGVDETDEVECAAAEPARVRRRDRPHPYEVSTEPLRTRLLSPPPELAGAGAPFLAHAHTLMSPRGLVRVGDHLLVMGEILDGDVATAAPGQPLVVEP